MYSALLRSAMSAIAVGAFTMSAAQAVTYTYSGDTSTAPTYNRPVEDTGVLSSVGTETPYNYFTFSPTASGSYTLESIADGKWDNYTFLYAGGFSASSPTVNVLAANDDGPDGIGNSQITYNLLAGQHYTYVVTGYTNSDAGVYVNTISGPGAVAAVPEPATYAMFGLGLAGLAALRRRRS